MRDVPVFLNVSDSGSEMMQLKRCSRRVHSDGREESVRFGTQLHCMPGISLRISVHVYCYDLAP
jgi:hypothetical protein